MVGSDSPILVSGAKGADRVSPAETTVATRRRPIPRPRLCARVLIPLAALGHIAAAQLPTREPTPEPAVPAILSLFDTYEVVGMNAAHRMKDLDDFILALVRNPA